MCVRKQTTGKWTWRSERHYNGGAHIQRSVSPNHLRLSATRRPNQSSVWTEWTDRSAFRDR